MEKSLFNSNIDDTQLHIDANERHACRVLFGIDYSEYTDKEFLLDKIPDCLMASSASFRMAFSSHLKHDQHALNPVVLEKLTVLKYRMSIIDFHKQLWNAYLKSGTGQMETIDPSRQNDAKAALHYWPPVISPFMRTKTAIQKTSNYNLDHERRIDLVKRYLAQLDDRTNHYRVQFDAIKNDIASSSGTLLHEIEHFVHKETLSTVKIYFEAVMSLMKYDYVDRLLQLQYGQQKPNEQKVGSSIFSQLTLCVSRSL